MVINVFEVHYGLKIGILNRKSLSRIINKLERLPYLKNVL